MPYRREDSPNRSSRLWSVPMSAGVGGRVRVVPGATVETEAGTRQSQNTYQTMSFESAVERATGILIPLAAAARPVGGWIGLTEPGPAAWWSFEAFGEHLFSIHVNEAAGAQWSRTVAAFGQIDHPAFGGRVGPADPAGPGIDQPEPDVVVDVSVRRLANVYRQAQLQLQDLVEVSVQEVADNVLGYLQRHHLTPGSPRYRMLDLGPEAAQVRARQIVAGYSSSLLGGLSWIEEPLAGDLAVAAVWDAANTAIVNRLETALALLDQPVCPQG